ncbi:MAG: GTP 3',8-cyclase MoaA [Candidatus Dormibacteria bacterium]
MTDTRAPAADVLVDQHGRIVNDLRISLTDRCNFRCVYCMPEEGLDWLPRDEILTATEIVQIARLFVTMGTRTIRLTGGEPLLRRDILDIVAALRGLHSGLDISLTTNGFALAKMAAPLATAGLRRVNVSLDSLNAERFARLARRDCLQRVLDGISAAQEAGLTPVKVNVVVMRGINDGEVADFANFARDRGVIVRFIEFMPLDASQQWQRDNVVASDELLEAAEQEFALVPRDAGHDPATRFGFADGAVGELGFISTVSAPFCDRCNRVRILADGMLRNCLFAAGEADLRSPLRAGADDGEMTRLIRSGVWGKQSGHGINDVDFARPLRSMSQIGG